MIRGHFRRLHRESAITTVRNLYPPAHKPVDRARQTGNPVPTVFSIKGPPVTDKSPPRNWFRAFLARRGWVILALLAGAVLQAIVWLPDRDRARDFALNGQPAQGELLHIAVETGKGWFAGQVLHAVVRFNLDGQQIITQAPVDTGFADRTRPGDPVNLRYLPDSPANIEPWPGAAQEIADTALSRVLRLLLAGGVFVVFLALLFRWRYRIETAETVAKTDT
jgi:hypothetical protein